MPGLDAALRSSGIRERWVGTSGERVMASGRRAHLPAPFPPTAASVGCSLWVGFAHRGDAAGSTRGMDAPGSPGRPRRPQPGPARPAIAGRARTEPGAPLQTRAVRPRAARGCLRPRGSGGSAGTGSPPGGAGAAPAASPCPLPAAALPAPLARPVFLHTRRNPSPAPSAPAPSPCPRRGRGVPAECGGGPPAGKGPGGQQPLEDKHAVPSGRCSFAVVTKDQG